MSLRRRLVVFGYPALELVTLLLVAQWIGLGRLLLVLLLGVLIGLAIMQSAGRNAFAIMRAAATSGASPEGSVRRHGMRFAAGALMAIPGIWCKLAGLVLVLPPMQPVVARRLSDWLGARTRMRGTGGDVVEGVVVEGVVVEQTDRRLGPTEAGPSRQITD